MGEGKILEFKRPEKPKQESAKPGEHEIIKLSPEQEQNFVFKFAWIVDVLHALKMADVHAIMSADVEERRTLVRTYTNEEIKGWTMKAEQLDIVDHAAFYEALTDIIIEKGLNRTK